MYPGCEDTFAVPSSPGDDAGDGARCASSISAASVTGADIDIKQAGTDIALTNDEKEDEDVHVHPALTGDDPSTTLLPPEIHRTDTPTPTPTPPSRVGYVYFVNCPSDGSSTSAAAVITPAPVYVQRRADLKTDAYWGPAATAAITIACDAADRRSYARYLQMEEQRKHLPQQSAPLSERKALTKIDIEATLALSDLTQEARKQTLKFREKVRNDGTDMWLAAAGTTGDELPSQVKPDPTFMSKRENEFAVMYIAREKLLAGGAREGEVALEGALREDTDEVTTFGDTGNKFHHIRGIIYGIPYTKTTCTSSDG